MLGRLHHVSITCSNLDKSVVFYQSLGLVYERYYQDTACQIILLKGAVGRVELFHFLNNVVIHPYIEKKLTQIGLTHIAFCTENIYKTKELFQLQGLKCGEVNRARLGGFSYFFTRDPDNNLIEIIEEE